MTFSESFGFVNMFMIRQTESRRRYIYYRKDLSFEETEDKGDAISEKVNYEMDCHQNIDVLTIKISDGKSDSQNHVASQAKRIDGVLGREQKRTDKYGQDSKTFTLIANDKILSIEHFFGQRWEEDGLYGE
jgi:hypothetical protein